MKTILVLDAMGVIYRSCDDVAELLIPYVKERNIEATDDSIRDAYIRCSLGEMPASKFWSDLNVNGKFEDEYLHKHHLTDGLIEWLIAFGSKISIVCLSNDVSSWSKKLRSRFGLEEYIKDWYISGDLGCRKPDERIYQAVEEKQGKAIQYVFLDDNPKNVRKAIELGWDAFLFVQNSGIPTDADGLKIIKSLNEIEKTIKALPNKR